MAVLATDDYAGTGALAAAWSAYVSTITRQSDSAGPSVPATNTIAYYNAVVPPANCYVRLVATVGPAGGANVLAGWTRLVLGSANAYAMVWDLASGGIYRLDGGVATLLQAYTSSWNAADLLEPRSLGSVHQMLVNGVVVASATDATYAAAGNAALQVFCASVATGVANSFEIGDIPLGVGLLESLGLSPRRSIQ